MTWNEKEYLCRKVENDVDRVESAFIEAYVLTATYQRHDGQMRCLAMSVVDLNPAWFDDQKALVTSIQQAINVDDQRVAHT